MKDTQWPRFEVFQQEHPGAPHKNVGSVHAPDAELAMMNARDVFVRRPTCNSLWVVPAKMIISVTQQELEENPDLIQHQTDLNQEVQNFFIFRKISQRRSMAFVAYSGQISATSPIEALRKAADIFQEDDTFVWWVCPEQAIYRSDESDSASMFEPADSKTYRLPREYRVISKMIEIRSDQPEERL